METIKINNLSCAYKDSEKNVLSSINLSIDEGEFTVISGLSGSGKSTLLRLMKKELMPCADISGSVKFKGTEIRDLDDRASVSGIGFVMQNPHMQVVTDTVWHELAFGLENLGVSNSVIKKTVAETASYFGINTWYRKKTTELSGGQKQLMNLAAVMVMKPELLILDEPTSQLDPIAAENFLTVVKKLNRELSVTVIIAEHRLDGLLDTADRLVILDKENIIYNASPESISGIFSDERFEKISYSMPSASRIYYGLGHKERCPLSSVETGKFIKKSYDNKISCCELDEKKKAQEEIIRLHDVWFRYSKNSDDIIRGLDMAVNRGEFFCILGGNGTGKTTLLNVISGVLKAHRGEIYINSTNTKKLRASQLYKNNIACLPQNPQLVFSKETVMDELTEMSEDKALIDRIISMTEISELLDRYPFDLSGGEQQKAALAKLLLSEPKILILDEATKGMDACYKRFIGKKIKALCESGMTVIMSTHDLDFAAEFADRCMLLFDGESADCEDTREFFSGNDFYTTSAAAVVRGYYTNILTCEDVIRMCIINGEKKTHCI